MTEPEKHHADFLLGHAQVELDEIDTTCLNEPELIAYAQACATTAGAIFLQRIDASLFEIVEQVAAARGYLAGLKRREPLRSV